MPANKRRRLFQRYGFNVIARNAGAKAEICAMRKNSFRLASPEAIELVDESVVSQALPRPLELRGNYPT
jgi:hypothetical protein